MPPSTLTFALPLGLSHRPVHAHLRIGNDLCPYLDTLGAYVMEASKGQGHPSPALRTPSKRYRRRTTAPSKSSVTMRWARSPASWSPGLDWTLRHRLHARLLQPPDHFRLKLRRVPRTPFRPRHLHRHHPVFPGPHPRHIADQEGRIAPCVQIPPLPPPRVVARASLAAMRTSQPAAARPRQLHPQFLPLRGPLHPGDPPVRSQAQNGVQPAPLLHTLLLVGDRS